MSYLLRQRSAAGRCIYLGEEDQELWKVTQGEVKVFPASLSGISLRKGFSSSASPEFIRLGHKLNADQVGTPFH